MQGGLILQRYTDIIDLTESAENAEMKERSEDSLEMDDCIGHSRLGIELYCAA